MIQCYNELPKQILKKTKVWFSSSKIQNRLWLQRNAHILPSRPFSCPSCRFAPGKDEAKRKWKERFDFWRQRINTTRSVLGVSGFPTKCHEGCVSFWGDFFIGTPGPLGLGDGGQPWRETKFKFALGVFFKHPGKMGRAHQHRGLGDHFWGRISGSKKNWRFGTKKDSPKWNPLSLTPPQGRVGPPPTPSPRLQNTQKKTAGLWGILACKKNWK